ncbi:PEP-utilizing enzyme, partial (plasmid) [Enterobacter asburiae]|uniref:PEP-utilizing enzyme n=1 Tax=Enterobacter asburiae TaxID=61645 RepID=UPI0032AF4BAF
LTFWRFMMDNAGPVKVIHDISEMNRIEPGDVLVTDMTDPDWEPIMKKAAAIVTNRGGRTCHAAIIARELGILRHFYRNRLRRRFGFTTAHPPG